MLINKFFKDVTFIKLNFECCKKSDIFFQETLFLMLLLVLDVRYHQGHLAFRIRKCTKCILPGKFLADEMIVIDLFGAFRFNNLDEL